MRLIDADKIGLTDTEILLCDGSYREALKIILDKINNAPSVDLRQKWIPCSERLPESNQEVLVCGDNGKIDVIIGFKFDDRWIWQMSPNLLFVKEIVAWQPLPEPYKKEGGEE